MKKIFNSYYFVYFFAVGVIFPLLPVYLNEEMRISKTSVGVIMSFIPLISVIGQPIWGYVSDYTKKFKLVLLSIIILDASTIIVLSMVSYTPIVIGLIFLFSFFYCGNVPLADRFSLEFSHSQSVSYGSMRLWGSIGFAVSTFIIGYVTESFGLKIIFYLYFIIMMLTSLVVMQFPSGKVTRREEKSNLSKNNGLKKDLKKLLAMPQYIFMILISMFSFSTLLANNSYLGLYIVDKGATLSAVGALFFVSAISEVPFMRVSRYIIDKFGVVKVLFISIVATSMRWFFYFLEPNIVVIYSVTLLQGIGFGLMLPCIMEFVKEIVPKEIVTTAISLISAIGFGFGSWFSSFIGGIILKDHSINYVYLLFFAFTLVSLTLLIPLNAHYEPEKNY